MEKTILIGENNKLTITATKRLVFTMGLLWLLLGVINLFRSKSFNEIAALISIVIISAGLFAIFYSLTAFSKNSRYSLRLKVSDSDVEYKSTYLKRSTRLKWDDIKKIELSAYKIDFHINKGVERFSYRSNPEVSKEIKETLQEIARKKNIPVSGG